MDSKDIFFKEKESCNAESTHIAYGIDAPELEPIDELFGAADVLSIRNSEKHRRILLLLSAAATVLTFAFLLYDEAELHGLIFACGAMVLCLFLIRMVSDRLECHRKYLEYRVLAESLRVQYYIAFSGSDIKVADILPWSVKQGIPWVREVMSSLHYAVPRPGRSILDCWVKDQKSYHEKALKKAEKKNLRDQYIGKTALIITVAAYAFGILFELVIAKGSGNADSIRLVLKILIGMLSVITIFTGSYYGKMSLPNVIDDHKRMIALYEKAEDEISRSGETPEIILDLARDFLNENSTWYAYQSKNKPDLVT